jgi:primosomal protein N' (replication factor Y)
LFLVLRALWYATAGALRLTIARVSLPVPAAAPFDYWVPDGLSVQPGSAVRVRLGRRRLVGVAIDLVGERALPPEQLLPLDEVVADLPPLSSEVLELARFVSSYYHAPLGQCLALALPSLTRPRRREEPLRGDTRASASSPAHALNEEQREAAAAIAAARGRFAPFLLRGVTGSGKTAVYLDVASKVIAEGGQVLLLVPEINLTPQLADRVRATLGNATVAVLHSGLPAGARRAHWESAATGDADVVLGTRLAVFAIMPKLGLIVVDEEHDGSYKQQEGVRYHARDVAVFRARARAVPIVLGSATPSLETHWSALSGRYTPLTLTHRAGLHPALPPVRGVARRDGGAVEGVGTALQAAIRQRLSRKEQTLLFVNRRGFAPSLLCTGCGWKAECGRCDARLVVHREPPGLRCHHCGHAQTLPRACPECGNQDLLPLGSGTQRLERAVATLFPQARVVRIDRDATRRKGAFDAMRDAITRGEADILVGTQMLAKSHDFPRLTLVGVLGADNALYSGEFRATESLFALLEQVAGRAGRGAVPGEVIVQTDFPDHPVYAALAAHDYAAFADSLLAERKSLLLPPFAHLALLRAEARREATLQAFLDKAVRLGRTLAGDDATSCEIYAPVPATLPRRAGLWRSQVLLQAPRRAPLHALLDAWLPAISALDAASVRWSVDVDPQSFA